MREIRRLQFLYFFVLIATIFLFDMSEYGLGPWFFAALILGSGVLMFFEKNHMTLIIVNGLILLVGLIPLFAFVFHPELLQHQIYFIFRYALFAFIMFLIWYIVYQTHKNALELDKLRAQQEYLAQIQVEGDFLTQEQFEMRRRFILKGSKRRKETCMRLEMVLLLSNDDPTFHAMVRSVEAALLQTLRTNYDLLYKAQDGYYVTLLQSTGEAGLMQVQKRILHHLNHDLLHPEKFIQFKGYEEKELGV